MSEGLDEFMQLNLSYEQKNLYNSKHLSWKYDDGYFEFQSEAKRGEEAQGLIPEEQKYDYNVRIRTKIKNLFFNPDAKSPILFLDFEDSPPEPKMDPKKHPLRKELNDGKFDFKSNSEAPKRGLSDKLKETPRYTLFTGYELKGSTFNRFWSNPQLGTVGSQNQQEVLLSIGRCKVYNENSEETKILKDHNQGICINAVSYSMFDDRLNAAFVFPKMKMQKFVVPVENWGINKYRIRKYFDNLIRHINWSDENDLTDVINYRGDVKSGIKKIRPTYYYYDDNEYQKALRIAQGTILAVYNQNYMDPIVKRNYYMNELSTTLYANRILNLRKNMTSPSLFLFTFEYMDDDRVIKDASDQVSFQSVIQKQELAGGVLMIQDSEKGREIGDDLREITGLETQIEFDILKAKCNVHHMYMLKFKEILDGLFEASRGIAVDAKDIESFPTAFALANVKDAHTVGSSAQTGLVLTGKSAGSKTEYVSSTPLLFQKVQHVSLVVEDPYEVMGLKVCFIFKKKDCYKSSEKTKYALVHKRVMCKTKLNPRDKKLIQLLNCSELTVSEREDDESKQPFDHIELKIDVGENYRIETFTSKRTAVQFDSSHSKIQFKNEPLQVFNTDLEKFTPENSEFANGIFSQIVLEAVPLPNWHRVREKSNFEKITPHWWQFWKKREDIDEGDMNSTLFEDVYVQIGKSIAGKRGEPNDVTYLCFGIEEESDFNSSTMWLQFTYTPRKIQGKSGRKNAFGKIESVSFTEDGGGSKSELLASLSLSKSGGIKWKVYDRFKDELTSVQFPSTTYLRVLHWALRRFQDGHTVPTMHPKKLQSIISHLLEYLELYPDEKVGVITPFKDELTTLLEKSKARGMKLPCVLSKNIEKKFEKPRAFLNRQLLGELLCDLGILNKYAKIKRKVLDLLRGWFQRKGTCSHKLATLPITVEYVIQKLEKEKNAEQKLAILTAWYFYTLEVSNLQNNPDLSKLNEKCEESYDGVASELYYSMTLKVETQERLKKMKARYSVQLGDSEHAPLVPFQAIALLRAACGV